MTENDLLKIITTIPISFQQIADGLVREDYDNVIAFIKKLESDIGDWEFTRMLGSLVHEMYKEMSEEDQELISEHQLSFSGGTSVSLDNEWTGHVFEKDDSRPTRCRCGYPEVSSAHVHPFVSSGISTEMCACGKSRLFANHKFIVMAREYEKEDIREAR